MRQRQVLLASHLDDRSGSASVIGVIEVPHVPAVGDTFDWDFQGRVLKGTVRQILRGHELRHVGVTDPNIDAVAVCTFT